jgi:hypothetical protein
MKYCKNCGSSLNDEITCCPECGNKVDGGTEVVSRDATTYNNDTNIKGRSLAVAIVLTIVTCGLYSIYWMIKINSESLELSGEKGPSGGVVILLTLVTCGIYGFFWWYKMGICSNKIEGNDKGYYPALYVVLAIIGTFVGFGTIVNYAIAQNVINTRVGKN